MSKKNPYWMMTVLKLHHIIWKFNENQKKYLESCKKHPCSDVLDLLVGGLSEESNLKNPDYTIDDGNVPLAFGLYHNFAKPGTWLLGHGSISPTSKFLDPSLIEERKFIEDLKSFICNELNNRVRVDFVISLSDKYDFPKYIDVEKESLTLKDLSSIYVLSPQMGLDEDSDIKDVLIFFSDLLDILEEHSRKDYGKQFLDDILILDNFKTLDLARKMLFDLGLKD